MPIRGPRSVSKWNGRSPSEASNSNVQAPIRVSDIVILAATRTPLGAFQGALAAVPAPRLGATAIRGAIAAAKIAPADVTDVLIGCFLQAGQGQAPARQAAIYAGLPNSV